MNTVNGNEVSSRAESKQGKTVKLNAKAPYIRLIAVIAVNNRLGYEVRLVGLGR